jgi:hypothetical protein
VQTYCDDAARQHGALASQPVWAIFLVLNDADVRARAGARAVEWWRAGVGLKRT